MYCYLTAFLAGILCFQHQSALPSIAWSALTLLILAAWKAPLPMRLGAMGLAGWLWAWAHAAMILGAELDHRLEGKDLLIEGSIHGLPRKLDQGQRFVFHATSVVDRNRRQNFSALIQLNWHAPPASLRTGDRWRLVVRLKRPHGFLNPGGFDYEKWLFEQRIRATGYVRKDSRNQLLDTHAFAPISGLRQSLADKLELILADRTAGGLVRALAVGDRSTIDPDQWRVLRATGTNHLVAISGLHIGMVAGWIYFLVKSIWNVLGLTQWVRASNVAALASIFAAGIYAALAGFSVPTQRAFCMVFITMFGLLLGHRTKPNRLLALVLSVVLILDPIAVLSVGFWLSFCAVALIIYLSHGRYGRQPVWWRWNRLQIGLLIGLGPLLLFSMQQVALLAPVANLIAIPWIGMLVIPLTLIGSALLAVSQTVATGLLLLAESLVEWLWPVLEWLAAVPGMVWSQAAPRLWTLALAAIGALWLIAPRGWPARWLGCVFLLPLLLTRAPAPAVGAAWVTLLDVGQGMAAVVRTTHHTLVYDTGPWFSPRFNTGSAVVAPFLRHYGLRRIDRLIVSHDDNDHSGGVQGLLDEVTVLQIWAGMPKALAPLRAKPCHTPQAWIWDQVHFELLHPQRNQKLSGNNASCVLRIESTGGFSILLPGDIEARIESQLAQVAGRRLSATVLVAPHHGSSTSSSQVFLEQVRPRYVLFPVGYRNRWGFPRPEVTGRYAGLGAVLLDTANDGAITVRLPNSGTLPPPQRHRNRVLRYWNDPDT
ncbi:MAG: DNA internalization-related competence protein ComEC/Rec2 [Gammaproteobacteria bacterium]